jgi:hypothetical protein
MDGLTLGRRRQQELQRVHQVVDPTLVVETVRKLLIQAQANMPTPLNHLVGR